MLTRSRWLQHGTRLLTVLALGLGSVSLAHAQSAPDQLLFGPKQYLRTTGPPNQYTDTFTVPASIGAPFLLHIVNGDADEDDGKDKDRDKDEDKDRKNDKDKKKDRDQAGDVLGCASSPLGKVHEGAVSGGHIVIDGVEVVSPHEFSKNADIIDKTLRLTPGVHRLEIQFAGAPGSHLCLTITGTLRVGKLAKARAGHTATLLADGTVLLTGGRDKQRDILDSAERWDLTTLQSTLLSAELTTPRMDHTATVLPTRETLLAAGRDRHGVLFSTELLTREEAFAALPATLQILRAGHSATLLPDGRVLILGGVDASRLTLAQGERFEVDTGLLYNPRTGAFTLLPHALAVPRHHHTATLLPNGQVLVTGGRHEDESLASAELFDLTTPESQPLKAMMTTPRARHTASLLNDGRVLIAGGMGHGDALASVEIFDPAGQTFMKQRPNLRRARVNHTATVLPTGEILIAGGQEDDDKEATADTELYVQPGRDSALPTVLDTHPASGATGVSRTPLIGIRFSEPINVTTLTASSFTLGGPGGPVAGTVSPGEEGLLAFFVPKDPLAQGTTYTLTLQGITDRAGNPLGTFPSQFTTVLTTPALSLAPATASLRQGNSLTMTVTSEAAADVGGLTVTLAQSGAGSVTMPQTVLIPEGLSNATFTATGITVGSVTLTATAPIRLPASSTLTITNLVPVLSALSPNAVPSGSSALVLTLIGDRFAPGATVQFGMLSLAATFVSPSQLSAVIPPSAIASRGTVAVIAVNPAPGSGPSNSLPFTIQNGPPHLTPIGNKTVALGSTLAFTVTATDPDNDGVTFAITPLPLPAHASFDTHTGAFSFTPDASQVGAFSLTFVASDGAVSSSETITLTVTGAPAGGITGVSGRVVDGSGAPLVNISITLKATGQSTVTNAQGIFTLTGLSVSGRQQLVVDGFAQSYAILVAPVDLIANVTTQLASNLTIPPIDTAHAVTINPGATTIVTNPNLPGVSVTIAAGTAKNANGTLFTGSLSISPVPEYGRPESRPVELRPGLSITIQPAGVVLNPPAPITFPNVDNMAPGKDLDLWSLSPDTGTFNQVGTMRVSADGTKLTTITGGVRKTAWHFAMALQPQPNQSGNDRALGQCTTCNTGSGADLQEGALTLDHVVPGVRTLGAARDLTLHYRSTSADVHPILPIDVFISVRVPVPSTFSARLTVGGVQQGSEVYWNSSGLPQNADSISRLGVQFDASSLTTGRYPYELMLFSNYSFSSIGGATTRQLLVRNERTNPLGAGWTLTGLDRLYLQPDGSAILAQGTGETSLFASLLPINPVSWWPGEGTAQDVVGVNDGTLQGGITFAAGQVGQAFNFDGVNDYVNFGNVLGFERTDPFTFEFWLKQDPTVSGFNFVIAKQDNDHVGEGYVIHTLASGQIQFSLLHDPSNNLIVAGSTNVRDGRFHHVAVSYDGSSLASGVAIYVDGVKDTVGIGADTLTATTLSTDPFQFGAREGATFALFKGLLDEIAVYNRVLTVREIQDLYAVGRAGQSKIAIAGTSRFLSPPGDVSTLAKNPDGTYQRTLKDGTQYQFNAQGLQTAVTDRNGNTTTYAYDGNGNLTTITDPVGQVTTLAYNGSVVSTITDPAGRVTQVEHDGSGNLTAITYADGSHETFSYDPQHRVTQRTDARGQVYQYAYDFAGRFTQATLPTGEVRKLTPTQRAAVPDLATGEGTKSNPAPLGAPNPSATFQDGNGHTSTFTLDALGRITQQTDALNRITTITRDAQGNPLTITRPNGAVTTMTYDAKGNVLTTTEQAIAATTTFTYEPTFNQVTSIKDPKNNTTTITYDAKGNPLTIKDASNNTTTLTYDTRGLLTSTKDALNQTTSFAYDTLGRLLTTTDPLNRSTTLTYDAAGNVATSTDALNRVTSFVYDAKNRLQQVTDPLTGVTTYTYDGNGNLLTVKDAKNQTTTITYDAKNRLASTTDPLGKVETYTYDGADNLLTRVTPKAETISFAYDVVNQLLSKTLPGSQVTSYTYDMVGNLAGVTDPDSALTMIYDLANRLTSVATTGSSNQPSVTLTYTYDKNGNRLTLVDPTATNTYVYDVLNRLTSLTSPAGATTLAYDALSRRTSVTLPNGTQATYTYDVASQVTAISHQLLAISSQLNKAEYVYNTVGNRTSLTDKRGVQNFGYDNLDRLTSADHPLLATPQAFAYDLVGNRTTNGSLYNTGNQLTEDANFTYEYDLNGNLTRKTFKASGNHTDYTYDAENRLIRVDEFAAGSSTPGATFTYRYDGLGRRIEKVGNGVTRRYVYDGEDILLEYDGANVLQARYTHGPGIDEPIAMQRGGATYFYHQDGLGTVTDLTDSTATTAQSYAYDAYGNIIQQTGTVENPYTYTGREFDAETGLYYYRARYYDPRIATFLQKDPTGTKGGPNPYAYADNNPLRFTDPSGLTPIPGYKWCGEGDDPTMKDPKNDLDKACEVHDGCYNPLIKKGLKLPGDVFEFPKDPALCAAKDDCDKTLCEAARKFKPNNSYDLVATIYIINLFCNYHQYGEHGGPLY